MNALGIGASEPAPSQAPTTQSAPDQESDAPKPKAPKAKTTTEASKAKPTSKAPAAPKPDPAAWASDVEKTALMGSESFQDAAGSPESAAYWITKVSATHVGQLHVTLQLTGNDAEAEDIAERAANYVFATAGPEHDELDWVIVEGADGVVIVQKHRGDYPLLSH